MIYFIICLYILSVILANFLVLWFGPAITAVNAFFLIGLDLVLRDWLHYKMPVGRIFLLIGFTGVVTYSLNTGAGFIAVASATSFTVASMVDCAVFAAASGEWSSRSHKSNVAGAAVDSLLFPTIAFGAIVPSIVAGQFIAKVLGACVWVWLIKKMSGVKHEITATE